MAKPPSEARAVFVNSTTETVSRLYAVRSSGRPDMIRFYDLGSVLELASADEASSAITKALIITRPSQLSEDEAARKALEGDKRARQLGAPPMFRVNIESVAAVAPLLEALRRAAPSCGLLLRSERDISCGEWPEDMVCKLAPELDDGQIGKILGLDDLLSSVAERAG